MTLTPFPAFAFWSHRVAGAGQNGMGRDRHGQRQQCEMGRLVRSTSSFLLCSCFSTHLFSSSRSFTFQNVPFSPWRTTTGRAGRGGTGPTWAATATRKGSREGGNGYICCYFFVLVSLLSFFSSFHSSVFPIIYFPTSTSTGGAQTQSAGRMGRDIRGRR